MAVALAAFWLAIQVVRATETWVPWWLRLLIVAAVIGGLWRIAPPYHGDDT